MSFLRCKLYGIKDCSEDEMKQASFIFDELYITLQNMEKWLVLL